MQSIKVWRRREIIYESGFNAERFWKCDFDGQIIATYISMIWNLNSHKLAGQCVCVYVCVCERERVTWQVAESSLTASSSQTHTS